MSDIATAVHKQPNRDGRGLLARFRHDRSGSTAIEFVMLAIPFSLLVFAILESCIAFAGQQLLANAADDIAREIRTGQLKAADVTEIKVRKKICDKLELLVAKDCPGLIVDLRSFPTFAEAAKLRIKLTTDKEIDTTGFAVAPGQSMSKNMLRVFYPWPVMTDFMRASMSNLKDNRTLQFATVTWQNEPFND
ncbi:TadE/TadG family type IV pilus assembly protein [Mesorhizobium sp. ANAO-SY3R2]|uniref:TadE/TadG family type IV pilus assembly protein n=1 Tax=Mesorhizobium sp. ANAO-SY3R2 TaxID=3166644 RepID=UPI00366F17D7